MHTLDDATLIQQFISGEATLAANQNLRVEPAFDSVQLLSKRGGLVASMKRVGSRLTVLIRRQSDYTRLLHQILLARHFTPLAGDSNQPDFYQYRADEIPVGYEVAHDTARTLWKEWWRNLRQINNSSIQVDLLIFVRDTWYPIRNIVCSEGNLFITTLVSEVSFAGNERLTWLRRLPATQPTAKTTVASTTATPMFARSRQPVSNPASPMTISREHQPGKQNQPDRESQPAVPPPSSLMMRRDEMESEDSRPDLRQVLRFRQGKLHVTTALGDIVVEGSHLKFRLDEERPALHTRQPVALNVYRDREGHAANL